MGGWRVLPRGEMMSASVADTRVDLVSNSTFDVSLVILAESDVVDRSAFSVGPPTGIVRVCTRVYPLLMVLVL